MRKGSTPPVAWAGWSRFGGSAAWPPSMFISTSRRPGVFGEGLPVLHLRGHLDLRPRPTRSRPDDTEVSLPQERHPATRLLSRRRRSASPPRSDSAGGAALHHVEIRRNRHRKVPRQPLYSRPARVLPEVRGDALAICVSREHRQRDSARTRVHRQSSVSQTQAGGRGGYQESRERGSRRATVLCTPSQPRKQHVAASRGLLCLGGLPEVGERRSPPTTNCGHASRSWNSTSRRRVTERRTTN